LHCIFDVLKKFITKVKAHTGIPAVRNILHKNDIIIILSVTTATTSTTTTPV